MQIIIIIENYHGNTGYHREITEHYWHVQIQCHNKEGRALSEITNWIILAKKRGEH
jgi:hypothetical protein